MDQKKPTKLTAKQRAFCEEYLIDLNASQAAMRAGYSKKTSPAIGTENLHKPLIAAYIAAELKKRSEATGITAERVLREMGRIAFADIREFYKEDGSLKSVTELGDDAAAAMAGMDIEELFDFSDRKKTQVGIVKKIKLHAKVTALDQLARHLGMFERDNRQRDSKIKVTIKKND